MVTCRRRRSWREDCRSARTPPGSARSALALLRSRHATPALRPWCHAVHAACAWRRGAALAEPIQEIVDQAAQVLGAGVRLGVELHRAKRLASVPDALVGAVVGVAEPGLPAGGQRLLVHAIAVVLAGDVATAG